MPILLRLYAWFVHLFTASGAVFSIFSLILSTQAYAEKILGNHEIFLSYLKYSFMFTIIAIIIDGIDGTLARFVNIKKLAPLDGALMDNIIDFNTYTITPVLWIFITNVVNNEYKFFAMILIIVASCYQFCQVDAKTKDHFFKGFPSYWNLAVYYLIYFELSSYISLFIIITLVLLTFVPIKYVYPSRMKYLSNYRTVIVLFFSYTLVWGGATIISCIIWPRSNIILTTIILSYITIYFLISLYRTFFPVTSPSNKTHE